MDRRTYYSNQTDSYDKWVAYAKVFPKLLGVQVRDWMKLTLKYLGIESEFNEKTVKPVWEQLVKELKSEKYLPINLLKSTKIAMMSTTDNPVDSLDQITRADKIFGKGYWRPTWRPDPFFSILSGIIKTKPWIEWIEDLEKVSNKSIKGNFKSFLSALEDRHHHFADHNCRASDYGLKIPYGHEVSDLRASEIFDKASRNQSITESESADFQAYMLRFSMGLDYEKGWVSQIHYGPLRNMRDVAKQCGGVDSGCDTVGGHGNVADLLRPLLNYFDNTGGKNQHKIFLYTLDKNDWMKIAGLSRIFPCVYAGMSWWYYDSVSGMLEYFRTIPDAGAGLCKIGPFVTDARNIYSLVPRTQVYRRCLSTVLGEFVEYRKDSVDEAVDLAKYLCVDHIKQLLNV